MASEEKADIPIDLRPSTSTFSFFENDHGVFTALCDFEKLAITYTDVPAKKAVIPTAHVPVRVPLFRSGRYMPYRIPVIIPWRKRKVVTTDTKNLEQMSRVRLEGDVEPLRLCLFDKKDVSTPCSIQAVRPPSPHEDVEELSEYFTHFVRVGLKMSALAESMYV